VSQIRDNRMETAIAFGPVPSRRLGRSLGINNVLPKVCTYSCVYCQLGRTIKMTVERQEFYRPEDLFQAVKEKVEKVRESGGEIDYLTFVPDGEPTLDLNLGQEIELLRSLGIPIAVISNASLVWRDDVREELMKADWVSLKVDSTSKDVWRSVDRPHGSLELASILQGIVDFASAFQGQLATETMLVREVNDRTEQLSEVADFLGEVRPRVAYLSIPTRPPAEEWVLPPTEQKLNQAYQLLSERLEQVEYLIGYEGDAFSSTGDVREDLLSITAVHPMRRQAVARLLSRGRNDWSTVENLVKEGLLVKARYGGDVFYVRRFS
jgi:wyosine [tRNA(Phe)-imidazoG37] synthetase (radical SAM superfamily)